jgi:hypothetical protein
LSHLKQRKEKCCLNCNAIINGRYCSICGQENLEPQESVWHLIVHFFNDITHFDGKFFSSVKYVVTKPGFLSSEYVAGRRMSYLNPVRFYVFTSFIFFLILFTFFTKNDGDKSTSGNDKIISKKDSIKLIRNAEILGLDKMNIDRIINIHGIDSLQRFVRSDVSGKVSNEIIISKRYRDRKQFDSLDKIGEVKDNFFNRKIYQKQFQLQEKYDNNLKKIKSELLQTAKKLIPQMLFVSLPFFALILRLLYIRRKKYYYVAHVIFTIHFYIFVYIQILLINFFSKIAEITNFGLLYDFTILLGLGIVYYMYRAMRNFYEQSRWKTLLKLIILCFSITFLVIFFMALLFFFSFLKM